MGITYVKAKIVNPQYPKKQVEKEFLVDSGTTYSVIPKQELFKIGINLIENKNFFGRWNKDSSRNR